MSVEIISLHLRCSQPLAWNWPRPPGREGKAKNRSKIFCSWFGLEESDMGGLHVWCYDQYGNIYNFLLSSIQRHSQKEKNQKRHKSLTETERERVEELQMQGRRNNQPLSCRLTLAAIMSSRTITSVLLSSTGHTTPYLTQLFFPPESFCKYKLFWHLTSCATQKIFRKVWIWQYLTKKHLEGLGDHLWRTLFGDPHVIGQH